MARASLSTRARTAARSRSIRKPTRSRSSSGRPTCRMCSAPSADLVGTDAGRGTPRPASSRVRVEPDRERAVVDQLDGHHRAEAARRDLYAKLPQRGRESEIEALRELRGRGTGEAGAATAARVGVERELRDDEGRAADVDERQVRPAGLVVEDPELRHAAGERVRDGLVV